MFTGVAYALAAGLLWGLIFISPLIVPDYPPALQSSGRYLALGILALAAGWVGRRRLRTLRFKDWLTAAKLALFGNLIFYLFLASAIQRTGAAISTMIIGTLPVIIPVCANLLYSKSEGRLSWRRLTPSLICLACGVIMVNYAELTGKMEHISLWRYISGIALALISVVCWTWYTLRNARWLKENPQQHPMMWATAQGLAILPMSLIGYLLTLWWLARTQPDFPLPLGPHPSVFIPVMLVLGIFCSLLGNLCWNEASQRLPTVLIGPLIVFETLAGLLYTFLLRQKLPTSITVYGIILLVVGVLIAIASKPKPPKIIQAKR